MSGYQAGWRARWEQHFYRWVDRRSPRANQVQLNRNNLYTFPNLTGLLYLGITLVIWLLGAFPPLAKVTSRLATALVLQ